MYMCIHTHILCIHIYTLYVYVMAFRAIRVNPLYFLFLVSAQMCFLTRVNSEEKMQEKMSDEDYFAQEPGCFPN